MTQCTMFGLCCSDGHIAGADILAAFVLACLRLQQVLLMGSLAQAVWPVCSLYKRCLGLSQHLECHLGPQGSLPLTCRVA